jgi:uncharacterized protein DUF3883
MKVAAKLMRNSDLTLFRAQFIRHQDISKQKAINLNVDVFIDQFFPALRSGNSRFQVAMHLSGPGGRPPLDHVQTATILKQQKNWRLDGRLVEDPLDEPERFCGLEEGDIAILGFEGDPEPIGVSVLLVSAREDRELHQTLIQLTGFSLESRQSMCALSADEVRNLPAVANGELLFGFIPPDCMEDAVYGCVGEGGNGLGPSITPETVASQTEVARRVGEDGEEAFEIWLIQQGYSGEDYEWVARRHARASFDFRIQRPTWDKGAGEVYVDVKSTQGEHARDFHMSMAEVKFAAREEAYYVARISWLTDGAARVSLLGGVSEACREILNTAFASCPEGVSIDSFRIDPNRFTEIITGHVIFSES